MLNVGENTIDVPIITGHKIYYISGVINQRGSLYLCYDV